MYSAPRYTTPDCSLVECSFVINNLTTSSLFSYKSAYQIKYALLFFPSCFLFTYPVHFVWQAHETRPIKPGCPCTSISPLHAYITINLMAGSYTRGNFAVLKKVTTLCRGNQEAMT